MGIPKVDLVIQMAAALNGRHKYFTGRGISEDVIDEYLLGWNDKLKRYSIPNFVDGTLWAIQYRASEKGQEMWGKYISEEGGRNRNLFNTRIIAPSLPYIVLTESPLDCLAMKSKGFPCIAKFDGNQGRGATWEKEWSKRLKGIAEIIIVPNNDDAGDLIAKSLMENVPRARAARLPEGIKDLTDLIVKHGDNAQREVRNVISAPPILQG